MMRVLLLWLLCATTLRADDLLADKSLSDVFAERGVTEQTNTFGHSYERTAAGNDESLFSLFDKALRVPLWQALQKTKYTRTQDTEPGEPNRFTVLNTGSSSHDRPVVEFWVDSHGFAYCLASHDPGHQRIFLVFRAEELQKLLSSYAVEYGKPIR